MYLKDIIRGELLVKRLIVFPGDITSPFFINEIEVLKKEFDSIVFISFSSVTKKSEKIVNEYGLDCYFVSLKNIRIKTIVELKKWTKRDYVKKELKKFPFLKKNSFMGNLKRKMYIYYYGVFYVISREIVKSIFDKNDNCDTYLYSYWLSRSAFCVSSLNREFAVAKAFSRAHRYDLYEERNSLNYLPFREYIANNIDSIYFISNDGKTYFEKLLSKKKIGECKAKLTISRLGTYNDCNIFKRYEEKNCITFASCSNIINVKRLDLIISALSFLQKNNVEINWIHIGEGNLKNEMIRKAENELIDGSYKFLGYVDNTNVLKKYYEYKVDYFINLSDSEGVPVSIMEALSMGIPVITRAVGGNSEIVNDENGLILSEPLSLWKEQILDFITNVKKKNIYNVYSNNAFKIWSKNYSAKKNYNSFLLHVLKDEEKK